MISLNHPVSVFVIQAILACFLVSGYLLLRFASKLLTRFFSWLFFGMKTAETTKAAVEHEENDNKEKENHCFVSIISFDDVKPWDWERFVPSLSKIVEAVESEHEDADEPVIFKPFNPNHRFVPPTLFTILETEENEEEDTPVIITPRCERTRNRSYCHSFVPTQCTVPQSDENDASEPPSAVEPHDDPSCSGRRFIPYIINNAVIARARPVILVCSLPTIVEEEAEQLCIDAEVECSLDVIASEPELEIVEALRGSVETETKQVTSLRRSARIAALPKTNSKVSLHHPPKKTSQVRRSARIAKLAPVCYAP
jgi:hypothetical protein